MTMLQWLPAFLSFIGSVIAVAFGWGVMSARLTAVEDNVKNTVSRGEFAAVTKLLDNLVSEVRGLRADLMSVRIHNG